VASACAACGRAGNGLLGTGISGRRHRAFPRTVVDRAHRAAPPRASSARANVMTWIIAIGVLVALGVVAMLWARSRGAAATSRGDTAPPARTTPAATVPAETAATAAGVRRPSAPPPAAPAAPPAELHPALAALPWIDAATLPADRRAAIASAFGHVPRPPRLLTQLVSMDLLGAASSAELVQLIGSEPLIAARVLAAVNSPAWGLTRTVTGVGQAVTFLGLNRVRAICMQYALMQAFRADSPERARRLSTVWNASLLAGELAHQGSQRQGMADPGGLTSAVLLSFIGQLAVPVGVPRAMLAGLPARDIVARVQAEQQQLGLGGPGIGQLLMGQWELPSSIVDEVAGLDAMLLQPWPGRADAATTRLAFGYLCARLGERLACGELADLAGFELAAGDDAELASVRSHLADPAFAALVEELRAPALLARVTALRQGLAATAARPVAAEAAIG
jgi:HD-like signal output (HDOD) protein